MDRFMDALKQTETLPERNGFPKLLIMQYDNARFVLENIAPKSKQIHVSDRKGKDASGFVQRFIFSRN